MSKGHAVAVLIVTPQGIPLIRDPKKPIPVYWKLPGGRGAQTETAEGSAVREIREELGMSLLESDFEVIHSEDKGNHIITIFRVNLGALPQMNSKGDEQEEIRVFTPTEILASQDFFPNHRMVVGKILVALP